MKKPITIDPLLSSLALSAGFASSVRSAPLPGPMAGLLVMVIAISLGVVSTARAFWPPLRDVTAWTEDIDITESPYHAYRVQYDVYDPPSGLRRAGGDSGYVDWIRDLTVADGVVAWVEDTYLPDNPYHSFKVRYATYDPASGSWKTGQSDRAGWIWGLTVAGGVVAWVEDAFLPVGPAPERAGYATFDPASGSWKTGQSDSVDYIEGRAAAVKDGVVAWVEVYHNIPAPYNCEVHYAIYDPASGSWKTGQSDSVGSASITSISNATVTYVSNGTTYEVGYSGGSWVSGRAVPFAYFVASPSSGNPPLTVWFTDMSIGASTWSWSFGDATGSNSRSPYYTYAGSDLYTARLTTTGITGTSTFSSTIRTDFSPPTGFLIIAGGASKVDSRSVLLNPIAMDNSGSISAMRFSDDGTTWSDWESFSSTRTWLLAPGDGVKTIYAQYRDGAGNQSPLTSASVLLELDSDQDGLPDWWETAFYVGATNGVPTEDSDHDGLNSIQEFIAGTCPTNSADFFHIESSTAIPEGYSLSWGSRTGRLYSVWTSTNLLSWCKRLQTNGTGGMMAYTNADLVSKLFLKLSVAPLAKFTRPLPQGLVLVEAGGFQMGSPQTNGIWYASIEQPVHDVYVSAFWMARYETSNEEMRRVLQWALDHGEVTADSISVQNLEGERHDLLQLNDKDCRIGFSNGVFFVRFGMDNFPCAEVSWYGGQAFCNYRSDMEGLQRCINFTNWTCNFTNNGYRLPTEAEWEKAARGGLVGNHFPWPSVGGDYTNFISPSAANYLNSGDPFGAGDLLNYLSVTPVGYYHGNQVVTNEVGQQLPGDDMANGYGLYDMAGNLYEWCWDWGDLFWYQDIHASDPDTAGPPVASTYLLNDITRIMRGGSWEETAMELRCGARAFNGPEDCGNGIGFRSVKRY